MGLAGFDSGTGRVPIEYAARAGIRISIADSTREIRKSKIHSWAEVGRVAPRAPVRRGQTKRMRWVLPVSIPEPDACPSNTRRARELEFPSPIPHAKSENPKSTRGQR